MKVGSTVICVDDNFPAWARATYNDLPVKDKTYKIRHIDYGLKVDKVVKDSKIPLSFTGFKEVMVLLEEIKNPIHNGSGKEMGFHINRFREVEPPKKEKEKIKVALPVKPRIVTKPKTRELVEAA